MKLPSLVKTPSYKRFDFTPRYYDPVKEELKNRTELIKKELDSKYSTDNELDTTYGLRLKGSFSQRVNKNRSQDSSSSQQIRTLLIVGLLCLLFYTYVRFGNIAIVILFFAFASYFYIKKTGLFNRSQD
jgi:hypothetical protein